MRMSGFMAGLIMAMVFVSCKKDDFVTNPNASLFISADSVKFDTVFTTAGSITKSFKIINTNDRKLLLSSVKLMGGDLSSFHLNIDGAAAPEATNIELAAKDSLYVFVTVTVDPTSGSLPFIVSDSIRIQYNNQQRFVQLQAYGQNARFLNNEVISGMENWDNTLPYVITGFLQVDTNATLNIEAGTKVYVHANASFLVDGSLKINGTFPEPVVFRGDRLDEYYRDIPGGWPGIYYRNTSFDNEATFAILKNATQAIVVDGPSINNNPKLQIHQCIIDNAFLTGIYALNSRINIDNTLISNCRNNIKIEGGGEYSLIHCTVAAYSNAFMFHTQPVASVSNSIELNGTNFQNDLNASFINCIFWGDGGNTGSEIETINTGSTVFNLLVDHCLYRADNDPAHTTITSGIRNQDPLFDSIDVFNRYYDFRISHPGAPGIDQGITTPLLKDLDDQNRNVGNPDLGSYELQ